VKLTGTSEASSVPKHGTDRSTTNIIAKAEERVLDDLGAVSSGSMRDSNHAEYPSLNRTTANCSRGRIEC